MPPTSVPATAVRPANEVNGDIRALWQRAGGVLSGEQRREYERLLVEWAVAVRAEVAEAA